MNIDVKILKKTKLKSKRFKVTLSTGKKVIVLPIMETQDMRTLIGSLDNAI